ncbi:hypothetical protein GTP23_19025 [Pseudoduganella sp. FT93W]|uniref:Uncharacterized protein n=1 Tax=Duganella fentianensis TaxID=2692177 RepID=A0A845I1N2_9BURK|nr:hypothetical protein [Duganella fentianensis]MYN47139.1 hypothetical protein [Duganella fentianensis]
MRRTQIGVHKVAAAMLSAVIKRALRFMLYIQLGLKAVNVTTHCAKAMTEA